MEQQLYELPEGWENREVDSLSQEIVSGFACNKKHEDPNGHVHLRTHNIDTSGALNFDTVIRIGREQVDGRKSSLKSGDILFNNTNSQELVGKTCIVDRDYEYGFSNHLTRIRVSDEVLPRYFVYRFVQLQLSGYFSSICKRWIGQAGINSGLLKQQIIPLPPLSEQKRIVAKLDALFTRIDAAIAHLQETFELSKALFASALDREFSALEVRFQIGDIAYVKGGKRLPKGEKLQDDSTAHPYIRVADFRDDGTIELSGLKYISDEIYEYIKRYTISSNDLYISIAGTIGKTGVVPEGLDGANLTENAAKIVFKEQGSIDVRFVYYFTLSHDFLEQAGLATKIVAQPKLALTRLSKIEVPLPALSEQRRIVSNLDVLAKHTEALETETQDRLDHLTALKSSLLDAAFRGQL